MWAVGLVAVKEHSPAGASAGITDNAMNYRKSSHFAAAAAAIGARQKFIRPHCPWTNCQGVGELLRPAVVPVAFQRRPPRW